MVLMVKTIKNYIFFLLSSETTELRDCCEEFSWIIPGKLSCLGCALMSPVNIRQWCDGLCFVFFFFFKSLFFIQWITSYFFPLVLQAIASVARDFASAVLGSSTARAQRKAALSCSCLKLGKSTGHQLGRAPDRWCDWKGASAALT